MRGLKYQMKSVLRDKFCLMTFLLPILVAVALHFMGSIDMSSLGELHFGVLENELSPQTVTWLERYGPVTAYGTQEELTAAINEPSTNVIGVKADGDSLKTAISGDELEIFRQAAATLPTLYERQENAKQTEVQVLDRPDILENFQDIFIPAVLIVAMFMGCTFNAMNIISEKEDGIAFINQVLPLTAKSYIIQKTLLGFIGGAVSTAITALICVKIEIEQVLPFVLILLLSAYISALIGLFIGYFSDGLMAGIVYIKIILILFLAPPIFFYLTVPDSSIVFKLSYLLPSSATFYGVMDLLNGQTKVLFPALMALSVHAVLWSIAYKLLRKKSRQK